MGEGERGGGLGGEVMNGPLRGEGWQNYEDGLRGVKG